MTGTRIRALAVLAAMATAACHNTRKDPPRTAADHIGVYQFTEHVSATGEAAEYIDLVGEVTVLADTVTVDARPGPCRADENVRPPTPFTYRCGTNVVLMFDRRDPTTRASYTATLAENATRQVCARYETDSNGRRYCAEMRTETYQRMAHRGGYLTLLRVPGGEAPKEPPR